MSSSTSAPGGAASRRMRSSAARDLLAVLAERQADGEARARGARDDRAALHGVSALDAVDVEARVRPGARVQLGGCARRDLARAGGREHFRARGQGAPRGDLVRSGRAQAGAQLVTQPAVGAGDDLGEHLREHVRRAQCHAAVDARVEVAARGAHAHVGDDDAAHGDVQRRPLLVHHGAVEDDRAVGAALVLVHVAQDARATDFLLALQQHAYVHRQVAGAGEGAGDVQQRQEVALVVARTARVEPPVAHDGIEGVGGPEAARLGRLHVVVPVDQHGRRIGPARAQLARAERVAVARQHLAAAAGRDDALAGPFGSSPEIRGVAAARGDRRDAQPVAELVEKRVRHEPEAILQVPAPRRPNPWTERSN